MYKLINQIVYNKVTYQIEICIYQLKMLINKNKIIIWK